tara:strand:- start:3558 stop:3752 length:195 start_codon:yes stop_codon:yes gene_type:complete
MNGWCIAEKDRTVGVGLVPHRKKACLYSLSMEDGTYEVYAVFSNKESANKVRDLLNSLAIGRVM